MPKEKQAHLVIQTQFKPQIPPPSPPIITITELKAKNYKRQLDTQLTKIEKQLDITKPTNASLINKENQPQGPLTSKLRLLPTLLLFLFSFPHIQCPFHTLNSCTTHVMTGTHFVPVGKPLLDFPTISLLIAWDITS